MPMKGETISCDSRITGKLIRVRHAVEADSIFIGKLLGKYGLDLEEINHEDFVVADEEGEILGFGRATKLGTDGRQFSVVIEDKNSYVADLIVKHLIEYPRKET